MRRLRTTTVLLLLGLVLLMRPAHSSTGAEAVTQGFRSLSYSDADNRCRSTPTGEKPQSKLWFHDGRWWGSLCNETLDDHHIYWLNEASQRWIDSGVPLDTRARSNADVLWDGSNGKLYVASHIFSDTGSSTANSAQWGRLYRYSYDDVQRTYTLDPGFPVEITRGMSETLTLARDGSGRLWVTFVENGMVMINHSLGDDASWATPFPLPVDGTARRVSPDDISAVIAFEGDRIGVMWSNQLTGSIYFAVHRDVDPTATWQPLEVALPGPGCASDCADDHISLATFESSTGTKVFAAIKSERTDPDDPLIFVLERRSGGQWQSHVFGRVRDNHTRPIVVVDKQHEQLVVLATAPTGGGTIYYKQSAIDDISFIPGPGTPIIQSAVDPMINDVTATKQPVTETSGLVVLASDRSTRFYLHNRLILSPPVRPLRFSVFFGG